MQVLRLCLIALFFSAGFAAAYWDTCPTTSVDLFGNLTCPEAAVCKSTVCTCLGGVVGNYSNVTQTDDINTTCTFESNSNRPNCSKAQGCLRTFFSCLTEVASRNASSTTCISGGLNGLHSNLLSVYSGTLYNSTNGVGHACRAAACKYYNDSVGLTDNCTIDYDAVCVPITATTTVAATTATTTTVTATATTVTTRAPNATVNASSVNVTTVVAPNATMTINNGSITAPNGTAAMTNATNAGTSVTATAITPVPGVATPAPTPLPPTPTPTTTSGASAALVQFAAAVAVVLLMA